MSGTNNGPAETDILGGGCFWCLEAVYERIDGVKAVTSGYAGGTKANPTYQEVSYGGTGHAEVVQIEYDPKIIPYDQILEVFWKAHDPTALNRQGADVGTQYRSIILYKDETQRKIAEKSLREADLSGPFMRKMVTEIKPLSVFYPAEDYHQDYFEKNPTAAYCVFVIQPKLEKLHLD